MKVKFSKQVKYVPTWNGNRDLPEEERISCELTVLNMGSLMDLIDSFQSLSVDGKVDTDKVESSSMKPIIEQFGSLLPKHVVNFQGLYDDAGKAIEVAEIVEFPKFMHLAIELLLQLSSISSPSEDDVKN